MREWNTAVIEAGRTVRNTKSRYKGNACFCLFFVFCVVARLGYSCFFSAIEANYQAVHSCPMGISSDFSAELLFACQHPQEPHQNVKDSGTMGCVSSLCNTMQYYAILCRYLTYNHNHGGQHYLEKLPHVYTNVHMYVDKSHDHIIRIRIFI